MDPSGIYMEIEWSMPLYASTRHSGGVHILLPLVCCSVSIYLDYIIYLYSMKEEELSATPHEKALDYCTDHA